MRSVRISFVARIILCSMFCLMTFGSEADLWVTGYYPGYETGQMSPANIDFTTITHVIHFSIIPNSDGSLNSSANSLSSSACSTMVSLAHAAGRKVMVCVGGASTEPDFQSAATPATLGTFVTNLANFMSQYDYDGIDIDWEPFNSSDTQQYTNFVNALRAKLNTFSTHKLMSVAAPAYPEYGDSPTAEFKMLASVQSAFDQINIMTYDLSGPYEGWVTWYNSPIYDGGYTFPDAPTELVPSINGAVSNFVGNGVAPAKLGIGIPFYGYIWTGGPGVNQPREGWPDSNVPTFSAYSYQQIVNNYYQNDLYYWDNVAQAAYLSITNTPAANDMFISYDDTHACESKISYARNQHLGGVMIWELSLDYFASNPAGQKTPLVDALKQALATPTIAEIQFTGSNVNISFTTAPLGQYEVQWSSNLANPTWNVLSNNIAGNGTNIQVTVPVTSSAQFYRIQTP
jgi:chitinase